MDLKNKRLMEKELMDGSWVGEPYMLVEHSQLQEDMNQTR